MNELNRVFGIRLGDLRRLNGMTQRELAEKIGVSPGFISKMERGLKFSTIDTLMDICWALSVPPSWLMDRLPPRTPEPLERLLQVAQLPRGRRMNAMRHMADRLDREAQMADILRKTGADFMHSRESSDFWKVFAAVHLVCRIQSQ